MNLSAARTVAKALIAAATAFVGSLGTALAEGDVSGTEWCAIAGTTIAALGLVYQVPNKTRLARPVE